MNWENIGMTAADALLNQLTAKQQYERQKKLMDIQNSNQQKLMQQQMQNQMQLNEQGQQIQLDTWEKTSYPAQVAMLQKAGLNPALLYGKGGSGGVTGSQSGGAAAGGSAASGTAVQAQANATKFMELQAMQSGIKLQEANARKANAEAKVLETYGGTGAEADIALKSAEKGLKEAETGNKQVDTEIKKIEQANTQREIDARIQNTAELTKRLMLENAITQETFDSIVRRTQEEATGAYLENELTKAKTRMTDAEIQALKTQIVQKWTELSQRATGLDQEQQKIEIQKWETELRAKYPTMMQVTGGLVQGALNQLETIGRWFNPKVFDYAKPKR